MSTVNKHARRPAMGKTTMVSALAISLAASIFALPALAGKDKGGSARATVVPSYTATGTFTDSTAAGLAGNKRVAISQVSMIIQTSTAGTTKGHWLLGAEAPTIENANSLIEFTSLNPTMVSAITSFAYIQLQDDLKAAGFEVVPEAQVKASPAYNEIQASAGVTNPSRYANRLGDAWYAGPVQLGYYMPYAMEVGTFQTQPNSYLEWGKAKAFKSYKSPTPGGPNATKIANNWKLPGLEIKLAKELNAHVVKATYVVTLGSIEGTKFKGDAATTNYNFALGLMQDQTRIAFRTATGKNFHLRSMMKQVPAKDGDVVVTLANPLMAQGEHFNTTSTVEQKADGKPIVVLHVGVKDEASYVGVLMKLAKQANDALLALVRR